MEENTPTLFSKKHVAVHAICCGPVRPIHGSALQVDSIFVKYDTTTHSY